MTKKEHEQLNDILNGEPWSIKRSLQSFIEHSEVTEEKKGNRTGTQNNALHKGFQLIADALNAAGLDIRKVLKPEVEIPWNTQSVKEYLFRPVMKVVTQKDSTTELNKVQEIDETWETVMRFLMQNHHIEYIPFPHDPTKTKENLGGYKSDDRKDLEYTEYNGQPEF